MDSHTTLPSRIKPGILRKPGRLPGTNMLILRIEQLKGEGITILFTGPHNDMNCRSDIKIAP